MTALAKLDVEKARDMLAKCEDLRDCRKIRDQASAMTAYARAQKASLSIVNSGTKIKLLAMARIGDLTTQMDGTAQRRNRHTRGRGPGPLKKESLDTAGLSKQEANRCEKVATAQGAISTYVEKCTASGEVASEEGFRRLHITVAHSSQEDYDSDEYGTPEYIVEKARKVMGSIDCDPASNATAQKTIRAQVYYTKKEDGLRHEWHGNIWLNQPYSMPLVVQFAEALLEECKARHAKQAMMLVNNATETNWFQKFLVSFPACVFNHRICFLDKNGKPITSPRSGQVLFYLGKNVKAFRHEFEELGVVIGRLRS